MSLSKKLLKHPRTITLISYVLAGYIWLVYATSRKDMLVAHDAEPYVNGLENGIFAFWHGRMMMLPALPQPRKMHVLISFHRDGKLISQVIGHFGQTTISGSTSRGGEGAVRNILNTLEEGDNVGITPDGPRGPTQQVVAAGAVSAAKLSQKPIIPITFSASRCIRLNSWDKFMLARPFGRLVFCVGDPIFVNIPEASDGSGPTQEDWCKEVERAMNRLVDIADEAAA